MLKLWDLIAQWWNKSRILVNSLRGITTGLWVWMLHILVSRLLGLPGLSVEFLPTFMTVGAVIGAIIGMVSYEAWWHKQSKK